jgi:murein DD-endopeptidase MepM/ murein hydrolase activator NlpD
MALRLRIRLHLVIFSMLELLQPLLTEQKVSPAPTYQVASAETELGASNTEVVIPIPVAAPEVAVPETPVTPVAPAQISTYESKAESSKPTSGVLPAAESPTPDQGNDRATPPSEAEQYAADLATRRVLLETRLAEIVARDKPAKEAQFRQNLLASALQKAQAGQFAQAQQLAQSSAIPPEMQTDALSKIKALADENAKFEAANRKPIQLKIQQPQRQNSVVLRSSNRSSRSVAPVTVSYPVSNPISVGTTTASGQTYNRKAFVPQSPQTNTGLTFPLSIPAPITSAFGWRIHPVTGDRKFHNGTDIGAPLGTPVLAAFAGRVVLAEAMGGYGLAVVLEHNQGTQETLYAHLSEILVKPGDVVQAGAILGRVGSTGLSTGPHLHFELRQLTQNGWETRDAGAALEYALAQLVKSLQTASKAQ